MCAGIQVARGGQAAKEIARVLNKGDYLSGGLILATFFDQTNFFQLIN